MPNNSTRCLDFDICSMSTVEKRHFYVLLLLSLLQFCLLHELTLDDIIKLVNEQNLTWKAGNTSATIPQEGGVELRGFARAKFRRVPIVRNIPKNFDAREKWPECPSLGQIRNQGKCGSCWAMSAAAVMTDRICIKSKGEVQFEFSAEELVTCCDKCKAFTNGCQGGSPWKAFKHWIDVGVVSGGEFESRRGCKPYSYGSIKLGVHPYCILKCTNHDYQVSYRQDKRHGSERYYIAGKHIQQVESEIFTNGPVVAMMSSYKDFEVYTNGIYTHKFGEKSGYDHGVKLIGWGVEDDVPYWLGANSWSTKWGDKGFFKIIKGFNHCGIETAMIAATSACNSLITHFLLYLAMSIFYFFI